MARTLRVAIILLVVLLGFGFSEETMKRQASEAEETLDAVYPSRKVAKRAPASVSQARPERASRTRPGAFSSESRSEVIEESGATEDVVAETEKPQLVTAETKASEFGRILRDFANPSSAKKSVEGSAKASAPMKYLIGNSGFPGSAPAAAPAATTTDSSSSSSGGGSSSTFTISSVDLTNGELVINGSNLSTITSIRISGGSVNATLVKTSSTSSQVLAMGLSAVELVLGTVYNLVISSANAQATFPIEVNSDFSAIYLKSANPVLTFEDTDDTNGSTATITAEDDGIMYYDANKNNSATVGGHVFRADNGTKTLMILENTGFVGIGIDPFRPLTVAGSMASSNGAITTQMNSDGGLGGGVIGTDSNHPLIFTTNSAERMRITTTGNLELGANGDGSVMRANAFTPWSDKRLKKDFELIPNALEKILSLNGYYYHWKKGVDKSRQMGVSAQEVQRVFPEVVREAENGYLTVSYDHLAAPMIEAMKEQNREIAKLKSENEMMKGYLCKKDPEAPFCK